MNSNDVETILEILKDYQESERNELPNWEIRFWYESPKDKLVPPSHWQVIGYAYSRQYACIIADTLHKHRGWKCEVWALRNYVDPDTGAELHCPVVTDRFSK